MKQQHEERIMSMFGTLIGQLLRPAAPYMGYQCNMFPYESFTEYPAFDHSSTSISYCHPLQAMMVLTVYIQNKLTVVSKDCNFY